MGSVSAGDPPRFRPHGAQVYVLKRLQRFNVLVCHRGWGKTTLTVNYLVEQATEHPDGRFAYLAPLYRQVKQAAWDALKEASMAPGVEFNESELQARFPNGARIQLFGAENYQALRGMHLNGIALDEYGDMHPSAWREVITPALAAKHGFAIFIGTPKGRNHFYEIYQQACRDPEWFEALYRFQDSEVIGPLSGAEALAEAESARKRMTAEEYAQEYECSFESPVVGAYYARQIGEARASGRLRQVIWEPSIPVETWWDLGRTDATAIIFTQSLAREIRIIDYYETRQQDLTHYVNHLATKPYQYDTHHLPHDARAETLAAAGVSIEAQLRHLGLARTRVHNAGGKLQGINEARLFFSRCWFDDVKAERLITCLSSYRSEFDPKKNDDKPEPRHDEFSHGADAFRLLAVNHRDAQGHHRINPTPRPAMQRTYDTTYDPIQRVGVQRSARTGGTAWRIPS